MPETKVVNLRKSCYDVYIGRAGNGHDGYFGNPYRVGPDGDRKAVMVKFKKYARRRCEYDAVWVESVRGLYGKRLGCFCAPGPCHGDILAELSDELTKKGGV